MTKATKKTTDFMADRWPIEIQAIEAIEALAKRSTQAAAARVKVIEECVEHLRRKGQPAAAASLRKKLRLEQEAP